MDYRTSLTQLIALLENKDHLIDRLDLTDEQKSKLKDFFRKYPNLESKIDWNRKDLKWKDFEPLLASEGKSKSQAKKYGISGLKEGIDYKLIWEGSIEAEPFESAFDRNPEINVTIYYPLTFLGSETLANPKVAPEGITGKWCIAGGNYGPDNDDMYFKDYVKKGYDFFFIFTDNAKFAMARFLKESDSLGTHQKLTVFNQDDQEVDIFENKYGQGIEDYEEKKCPDFWKEVFTHINGQPQNLVYGNFLDIHEDGSKWEKGKKVLINAGKLAGLKEWKIPADTFKIEPRAFQLVSENTTIIIPKNSNIKFSYDDEYDFGVFSYFKGTVAFEEGTKVIPSHCFLAADNLKDIILPDSIEVIDTYAFTMCNNEELFSRARKHTSQLSFDLPNLKEIKSYAFMLCDIQEFPFQAYPDMKYGYTCFKQCRLEVINLPEGMKQLPMGMFISNSPPPRKKYFTIFLPRSLKEIGYKALDGIDTNHGRILFNGTIQEWLDIETNGYAGHGGVKAIWEPKDNNEQTVNITFLKEPTGNNTFGMDQEGNLYDVLPGTNGFKHDYKLRYKHHHSRHTIESVGYY